MAAGQSAYMRIFSPFLTAEFLPEGAGEFRKGFYSTEEIGRSVSS